MNINLRNKTIFTRMFMGFMLVLALSALMGGILLYNMRGVTGVLYQITARNVPSVRYATQVERYALRTILDERNYPLFGKKEIHEQGMQDIREVYANLDRMNEVSEKYNDQALLQKSKDVRRAVEEYQEHYNHGVSFLEENKALAHKMRMLGRKVNELCYTHTLKHKRLLEEAIAKGIDQTKYMEGFHLCTEIEKEAVEARIREENYILYKNQLDFDGWKKHIANLMKLLEDVSAVDFVLEHRPLIEETRKAADEYLTAGEKWFANDNELRGILSGMHEIGIKVQETALSAQEVGWQGMDTSRKSALQTSEKAFLTAILLLGITLITAIFSAFFISRRIASPIKELSGASAAIAEGDLGTRVAVKASDELGQLAVSFNTMAASLQNTMVEIGRKKSFSENIIATIPDSLLVLDKDLKIKKANRTFYETFQSEIDPEKVIGSSIAEILHDKDGKLSAELKKLFGTEDMLENFELCYQSEKLGERIFNIKARGIIFAEEEEEEEEELIVLQDITERKHAEEELRQSEEKYQSLVDSTEDSIYLLDRNYTYLFVNKKQLSRLGLAAEEAIGRTYAEFHSEDDTKDLIGKAEKVLETSKSLYYEYRSQRDGRYFLRTLSPVKVTDGRTRSVTVISKDITEQKRIEEDLRTAYAELKETQRILIQSEKMAALGRFSSGISHQVKNPLAIILGGMEFVERRFSNADPETSTVINNIKDATFRADTTIQDLLRFSRPSKLEAERLKADDLVSDTLSLFKPRVGLMNIRINTHFAEELLYIEVDKNQIEQVLFNLLMNALDAMPKGGEIDIKTYKTMPSRSSSGKPSCVIEINDTGEGISEEELSKIFEPFFTTKVWKKGTGLGLPIAKRIVEDHNGTIIINSELEKGTEVKIILPLA